MVPPTLEMCPLILKFETNPLHMFLLHPCKWHLKAIQMGSREAVLQS